MVKTNSDIVGKSNVTSNRNGVVLCTEFTIMGAGASSERALHHAILATVGSETSPNSAQINLIHPRSWKIAHVSQWLRQHEMTSLVATFENHGIDGQVLLDDIEEPDFDDLVPFRPLRRKLKRCVEQLREQSSSSANYASAVTVRAKDLHDSLDNLNQSMETLLRTVPWNDQQKAEINRTLAAALRYNPASGRQMTESDSPIAVSALNAGPDVSPAASAPTKTIDTAVPRTVDDTSVPRTIDVVPTGEALASPAATLKPDDSGAAVAAGPGPPSIEGHEASGEREAQPAARVFPSASGLEPGLPPPASDWTIDPDGVDSWLSLSPPPSPREEGGGKGGAAATQPPPLHSAIPPSPSSGPAEPTPPTAAAAASEDMAAGDAAAAAAGAAAGAAADDEEEPEEVPPEPSAPLPRPPPPASAVPTPPAAAAGTEAAVAAAAENDADLMSGPP